MAQAEGGWGCGHGKQRGKCRECREERADGNAAGQQAYHAMEQGVRVAGGKKGERQRVSTPQWGRNKCEHNRERRKCKGCEGARICQHNRRRNRCKDCGGASICQHDRRIGRKSDDGTAQGYLQSTQQLARSCQGRGGA